MRGIEKGCKILKKSLLLLVRISLNVRSLRNRDGPRKIYENIFIILTKIIQSRTSIFLFFVILLSIKISHDTALYMAQKSPALVIFYLHNIGSFGQPQFNR